VIADCALGLPSHEWPVGTSSVTTASAADKTVTQPTAQTYKGITQGALVTGRIRVGFTILTNLSSGPERDRAREAHPPTSATSSPTKQTDGAK
jgi:hypothetical protein